MTRKQLAPIPLVDVLKALASQLIVWHHLAFYGPMSDAVHPHATDLVDWLYEHARLAVQVFLVVGGFLAARSLFPRADAHLLSLTARDGLSLVWRRYVRLGRPYVAALVIAIVCAWLARWLVDHPSNPEPAGLFQILANATMLQDVLGAEALSAGVWYVAIDLQLYALMVGLCMAAGAVARLGPPGGPVLMAAIIGLALASLLWINLQADLDMWAPYFFGAYGLGIAAHWISVQPRKGRWIALLGLVVLAALAWEWRSRILVAGLTALLLAACSAAEFARRWAATITVSFLARISYGVFLIHYPVLLVVGALVQRLCPGEPAVAAFGLLATWLLSLAGGALLHRWIEAPRGRPVCRGQQMHSFEGSGYKNQQLEP